MSKLILNPNYQRHALKVARELRYGNECIDKIKNAKSNEEIQRILTNERERSFED